MNLIKSIILMLAFVLLISNTAYCNGSNLNLINPINPSSCLSVKIDFDWDYTGSNIVKDSGYTLQIARDVSFSDIVVDVNKITSSSFSLEYGLDYKTTYYWRITAEFDPSGSETSSSSTFTTGDNPPRMVTPLDLTNCMDFNNIYFKWENLFADDNQIDIATSNTFGASSLAGYPMSVAGYEHTFNTGPLDPNTKYFWRVRAQLNASCGWTEWKDTFSFRTTSGKPMLAGPADASVCISQTGDFWWDEHPGAKYYHIQFSTDPLFATTDIVYQRNNLTSNTFSVPDGELDGYTTYFWRVRVIFDDVCATDWSDAWYFKTKQSTPNIVYPAVNQGGVLLTPVFYWETETYPDPKPTYQMQVSKNVNFTDLVYDVSGITSTENSCTYTLDDTEFEYNKYYYLRVRAQFGAPDNCLTAWSTTTRFKTVYPQAGLLDPMHEKKCIDLKYTFNWDAVAGAKTYRVQIAKDPIMSDLEINLNNVSGLTRSITLKSAFTKYYWRVRAEDATTYGIWSPVFEFTTNSDVPKEVYPKNNAVSLPLSFDIYWTSVHPDALYDLKVSKKSDMSNPLVDVSNYNSNTFTVTLPEYYETYYWQVRSAANSCISKWSSSYNFSTGLPKTTLLLPKNNSEKQPLVPRFSWVKTPGTGNKYEIQVAEDNLFTKIVFSRKELLSNSTSIDITLDPLKGYYWRIKATNKDGESPWSDFFKFITGIESAKTPVLLEPADNSSNIPVTTTLKWNSSENALRYLIQVAKDVDFSNIAYNYEDQDNLTDTTLEITGLDYNETYYWRAAATNDNSTSGWTDGWLFVTQNTPPENAPIQLAPLDGSSDVVPPVKFIWDPVVNTTKYQLQITTNSATFTDEDMVIDATINAPVTEYIFPGTVPNTTYYWRLRAQNNSGSGPWTETWSFTTTVSGINDTENNIYNVSVVPNPTVDKVFFNFNLPTESKVEIEFFDMVGRNISTVVSSNVSGGLHSYLWDTSVLNPGVYIYSIRISSSKLMGKIIVNK
jgi:hypothetical protein